jgi:hypothetical protein
VRRIGYVEVEVHRTSCSRVERHTAQVEVGSIDLAVEVERHKVLEVVVDHKEFVVVEHRNSAEVEERHNRLVAVVVGTHLGYVVVHEIVLLMIVY